MKHYKIGFYILFFSFIWISCESDKTAPTISILSPIENSAFYTEQLLKVEATISDDKELDLVEIKVTYPDASTSTRTLELTGTTQSISEEFDLKDKANGGLKVEITATDKVGNSSTSQRLVDVLGVQLGSIKMNFKLQYNGEPLAMFSPYTYPEGNNIDFTRCSFYTSEMKLDETTINEVEFHNLTNSHASEELAAQGYDWTIENIVPGSYDNLSFNIGVPAELNKMDPGAFPSGHPLAKPAENWFSWNSYIFLKVEGNIDLDGDGELETGVALHTGADDALRNIELEYPIEVVQGQTTEVNLVFDIYQLFDGPDRIYPIGENPQLHSLSQMDAVEEISNNLIYTIRKF